MYGENDEPEIQNTDGFDSPRSRAQLPIALLLAFLTEILLAVWITTYILVLYEPEEVEIMQMVSSPSPHYEPTRISKTEYLLWMALPWYIFSMIFLYAFLVAFYWVELNKDYKQSN